MAGDLSHELSVSWSWFKLSVMNRMQDALTFMPIWLAVIFNTFLQVVFFKAIYSNTQSLAGWSYGEVIVLLGSYRLLHGLEWGLWMRGGFHKLPRDIESGAFDSHMVRPINLRIQFIFNNADVFSLAEDLIIGGILILYGLSLSGAAVNWPMYLLMLALACIIHYSAVCLLSAFNFWFLVPQMSNLIGEMDDLGKYPGSIYRGAVKWALTLVIPLVCIYSFPVQALLGNLSVDGLLIMVGVTVVFWFAGHVVWNAGLRKYESAQG